MPVPAALSTCFALVASLYALPPRALPAIMVVEGGRVDSVHRNADGSDDLGLMQINTRWLPSLSRYTGLRPDDLHHRLLSAPCFNIAIAGAILRGALDETGGDLLQAVGDYHSHTPPLNHLYRAKVLSAAAMLFQSAPKP